MDENKEAIQASVSWDHGAKQILGFVFESYLEPYLGKLSLKTPISSSRKWEQSQYLCIRLLRTLNQVKCLA